MLAIYAWIRRQRARGKTFHRHLRYAWRREMQVGLIAGIGLISGDKVFNTEFYDCIRPHQSLERITPEAAYFGAQPMKAAA